MAGCAHQCFAGRRWLESCDIDALAAGRNLALIGNELVQFGDALPLGNGAFRLSRLLRGRGGTEWAMAGHSSGEPFFVVERSRMEFIPLTAGQTGAEVRVTPFGLADVDSEPTALLVRGDALRPPSPAHLRASFDADGNLACSWVRRSRNGWQWLDGVDAPLGAATELYRATLSSGAASVEAESPVPQARFEPAQIAALGAGPLQLSVVQVGDFAISRVATAQVTRS